MDDRIQPGRCFTEMCGAALRWTLVEQPRGVCSAESGTRGHCCDAQGRSGDHPGSGQLDRCGAEGELSRSRRCISQADVQRLHLSIHEHVWSKIAGAHEALVEIAIHELVHTAIDAGFGSEKAECAADVLVSMGGTLVRGRVVGRLRKVSQA